MDLWREVVVVGDSEFGEFGVVGGGACGGWDFAVSSGCDDNRS